MNRFSFNPTISPPTIFNIPPPTNIYPQQRSVYPNISLPPPPLPPNFRSPPPNMIDLSRPPPPLIVQPNNFTNNLPRSNYSPLNNVPFVGTQWPPNNYAGTANNNERIHSRPFMQNRFHNQSNDYYRNQGFKRPFTKDISNQSYAKKTKFDKRDLLINNNFVCENCDRGFKNLDSYNTHVATHVKCRDKNCKYEAHPKLVEIHYQTQHVTGLAKKIWSLETEEDIKNWREERKKNFPTAANIERKKKERAEKISRGEIVENKKFGKMKKFKENNRSVDQKSPKSNVFKVNKFLNETNGFIKFSSSEEIKSSNENMDKHENNNIEEEIGKGTICIEENIINNDLPKEINSKKSSAHDTELESESFKNKVDKYNTVSKRKKHKRQTKQQKPQRTNLLEMLLANDIRKERNVILQCVRYIVKNILPKLYPDE